MRHQIYILTYLMLRSTSQTVPADSSKPKTVLNIEANTDFVLGSTVNVEIISSSPINKSIHVTLFCDGKRCSDIFDCVVCENRTISAFSTTPLNFSLLPKNVGTVTLFANTSSKYVDLNRSFVNIRIGHSLVIDYLAFLVGWTYFFSWALAFIPQIWKNFRRKSVVGLNFEFLGLSLTGFIFYAIFNVCLYFFSSFQRAYRASDPRSGIPVQLNDVGFSVYASVMTGVAVVQCFFYETGGQKMSRSVKMFLILVWAAAAILFALVLFDHLNKLVYIYYLSYMKLALTIFKYAPQAWFNYKRKSTEGWSIGYVVLDCIGGVFSIIQMFLLTYNYDEWSYITGNLTKLGLGLVTIMFDALFMVQHYYCYSVRSDDESRSIILNSIQKFYHGSDSLS